MAELVIDSGIQVVKYDFATQQEAEDFVADGLGLGYVLDHAYIDGLEYILQPTPDSELPDAMEWEARGEAHNTSVEFLF